MEEDKVWVEIETTKGTNSVYTFRGQLDRKDLLDWINGINNKKCIKLEKTHWVEREYEESHSHDPHDPAYEGDLPTRVVNYRTLGNDRGQYKNHSGTIYILTEHISIIYELKSGDPFELYYYGL